jgi:hypothetical protein
MTNRTNYWGSHLVCFLLTLAFVSGCGQPSDKAKSSGGDQAPSETPPAEKPYVEVLLGGENYEKVASQLDKGKKLKFKGEVALAGSKGKKVVVHLAELYTGDQAAVQAAALTKDFLTDRPAAEKKYKREQYPNYQIIVEGVVTELLPDSFRVHLAGSGG